MSTEKVTVEGLGEWGFRVGNEWYGYSKKWPKDAPKPTVGETYEFDVWAAPSGKKYVNKYASVPKQTESVTVAPSAPAPAPATAGLVVSYPKARDFDAEARGKTRCVAFGAALQSPAGPAYSATAEEYLLWVKKMADEMVRYTFGA